MPPRKRTATAEAVPEPASEPRKTNGGADAYEFDVEEAPVQPKAKAAVAAVTHIPPVLTASPVVVSSKLVEVNKKLGSPPKGKDALLKLLKIARTELETLPQDVASLGSCKGSLPGHLLQPALMKHEDKDVKLHVALCLTELLRVFAPDTPFTDPQLEVRGGVGVRLSKRMMPGKQRLKRLSGAYGAFPKPL
ncbi:MAG: hypothetical protein WDW36_005537 [Sanguina aurantia]